VFAELLYTASITLKKPTLKKKTKEKIILPTLFTLYWLKRKGLQAFLPLTYHYVIQVPWSFQKLITEHPCNPHLCAQAALCCDAKGRC